MKLLYIKEILRIIKIPPFPPLLKGEENPPFPPLIKGGRRRDFQVKKTVTIIELVIVIVIVGILTVGISSFIVQIMDTWKFVDFRNEVAEEGKKALDWLVRDIKQIKDKDSVLYADSSQIIFVIVQGNSDFCRDYNLAGNTIQRYTYDKSICDACTCNQGANTFPLCDYIETNGLTFEYHDESGDELQFTGNPPSLSKGNRKKIRSIKITLNLKRGEQKINFSTFVYPRSL